MHFTLGYLEKKQVLVQCRNHGLHLKKLYASVVVPQLLFGFLANCHLPRVLHQSANHKNNNENETGAVHRSPGIYLTAEANPG